MCVWQAKTQLEALQAASEELERDYTMRNQTMSLLSNVSGNARKLSDLIDAHRQQLVMYASEWEKHRLEMMRRVQELKGGNFVLRQRTQDTVRPARNV